MNEIRTVVYRHPKGRYIVVERRGKSLLGGEYRIREAEPLPPKGQDDEPPSQKRRKPHMTSELVTERDQARFAELRRQGYSAIKIARITGRSESTVFRHLNRMGLVRSRKRLTDGEKAQIKNLARDGATYAKIAKITGWSTFTVRKYLKQAGLRS